MKKNEKGFGAVEGLLILLIVAILGLVGWYVWYRNQNNSTATTAQPTVTNKQSERETKPVTQPVDVTANWKTYTSTLGGFTIKYPDTLYAEGYSKKYGEPGFDSEPVSISKFSGKEYWINLYSKNKKETKNNFVMDIRIDPSTEGNTPADTYGKGRVIKTLSNGFEIWQVDSDSCLTTNLVTSKSNKGFVKLSNGKLLKYYGTFCYGQGTSVSYSLKQQLSSSEYKTALEILSSIKFD